MLDDTHSSGHFEVKLDAAPILTSRRAARWVTVCFGMALLAACGRSDLTAVTGVVEGLPAMAGAGAAFGGATFAGGGGRDFEVAGAAGQGGLVPAGASAHGGAAGAAGAAGAPAGSTQVDDFGDYQVVQRALGGSSQRVRIGGTAGSLVASVQAQVVSFTTGTTVIVPWTELGVASAAAYSGALDVPQGGWYRIVVRGLDDLGNEVARAAGAHRWGVGINILCIGQSNMVGHGGHSYTTAVDLAGLYGNDRSWKHLADPYDSGGTSSDVDFDFGSGASLVPSLVNALSDYFPGLPIGVIPAAKGSSPLACTGSEGCWGRRDANDPADPSTLYGNSLAKARSVGGVELIVMHQGETDATNSTPSATYASELARLAQNYRADLGDVPLFMCQLGRSTTDVSLKNRTDSSMQAVRIAQHDADDPPRIYLAATAIDLDVDETDHYVKPTLDELGRRIAAAIAHHYHAAGAPPAYRGPEIASASYADESRTVIDVHLHHRGGSDFAPSAGINGFVVLDDGAPTQLASVARSDAATIRITLEAAIVGAGSVRYLHGKLPFQTLSNTVHDDSRLELPLEPTTSDLLLP
jgi:hypothetical protein